MRSHRAIISADFPALRSRVDNPQSCLSSDYNRCERGDGPIRGRKTAREAPERIGPDLQPDTRRMIYISKNKNRIEREVPLEGLSALVLGI